MGKVSNLRISSHGFRSKWLQDRLESVTPAYGFSTVRTSKISRFQYRPPTYWPEIAQWQREQDEARRFKEDDVIWIYRDPGITQVIADTVAGRISCSQALGYPECCVNADFERSEYLSEGLVNGLRKKFKVDTPEEVIALLIRDEGVMVLPARCGCRIRRASCDSSATCHRRACRSGRGWRIGHVLERYPKLVRLCSPEIAPP